MPDLNTAIAGHTATMQGWWKLHEYIKERKAFVKRHPVCVRCGRPTQTPGHSHEDYKDFKTYLNAVKSDKCDPICSACNRAERAGRHPCPSCVEKYHSGKQDWIHYIPQDREICAYCEDPGFVERARAGKAVRNRQRNRAGKDRYNRAHPTVKRVVNGEWVEILALFF